MTNLTIFCGMHTPKGFRELQEAKEYYFLGNDSSTNLVRLVEFIDPPPRTVTTKSKKERTQSSDPRVVMHFLPLEDFEKGLLAGKLAASSEPRSAPWVDPVTGPSSAKGKVSLKRFEIIQPLLDRSAAILQSPNPTKALLAFARANRQNGRRICAWFFAAVVFGQAAGALAPRTKRMGRWNRGSAAQEKRLGRPKKSSPQSGFNMTGEAVQQILLCYEKYAYRGESMTSIHCEALRSDFDCKPIRDGSSMVYKFVSKTGAPFPSLRQFRYHVEKKYGREEIQKRRFGEARFRTKIAAVEGGFREYTSRLLEAGEADAYYTDDAPISFINGEPLKPLAVVVLRCRLGMKVGIGFSTKGETAEAYRMALFCAAIDKAHYFRLLGMEDKSTDDWPSIGLPLEFITDRGPGAVDAACISEFWQPAMRSLAPAYSGQSKAIVESGHPRKTKIEGAPTHRVSGGHTIQMVRREIERLVYTNKTTQVDFHLPADVIGDITINSPIQIWNSFSARGRTSACLMSFDQAVRSFLRQELGIAKEKGVVFNGTFYGGKEYNKKGLHILALRGALKSVSIYVMPFCLRYIWLEYKGALVELEMQLPIPSGKDAIYLSLADLQEKRKYELACDRAARENRSAAEAFAKDAYEEREGIPFDSVTVRRGRRKRTNAQLAAQKSTDAMLTRRPHVGQ